MAISSRPFLGRKLGWKRSDAGAVSSDASREIGHGYRQCVGAYLQKLRIEKGMTQRDFGKALGIGNTAVSAIEHGRVSLSPEHYTVIAALYTLDGPTFGKYLLEMTNPWLFALMFGDGAVDLESLPVKVPPKLENRKISSKISKKS